MKNKQIEVVVLDQRRRIRDYETKIVNGARRFKAQYRGCEILIECRDTQTDINPDGEYWIEIAGQEGCVFFETEHRGYLKSALRAALMAILNAYKR